MTWFELRDHDNHETTHRIWISNKIHQNSNNLNIKELQSGDHDVNRNWTFSSADLRVGRWLLWWHGRQLFWPGEGCPSPPFRNRALYRNGAMAAVLQRAKVTSCGIEFEIEGRCWLGTMWQPTCSGRFPNWSFCHVLDFYYKDGQLSEVQGAFPRDVGMD